MYQQGRDLPIPDHFAIEDPVTPKGKNLQKLFLALKEAQANCIGVRQDSQNAANAMAAFMAEGDERIRNANPSVVEAVNKEVNAERKAKKAEFEEENWLVRLEGAELFLQRAYQAYEACRRVDGLDLIEALEPRQKALDKQCETLVQGIDGFIKQTRSLNEDMTHLSPLPGKCSYEQGSLISELNQARRALVNRNPIAIKDGVLDNYLYNIANEAKKAAAAEEEDGHGESS